MGLPPLVSWARLVTVAAVGPLQAPLRRRVGRRQVSRGGRRAATGSEVQAAEHGIGPGGLGHPDGHVALHVPDQVTPLAELVIDRVSSTVPEAGSINWIVFDSACRPASRGRTPRSGACSGRPDAHRCRRCSRRTRSRPADPSPCPSPSPGPPDPRGAPDPGVSRLACSVTVA